MINLQLFLGFPLHPSVQQELHLVKPELLRLYVCNDPTYLQKIEATGGSFLGKVLGSEIDLEALRLAESNIYSLLLRLLPNYPFQNTALLLFPIENPPCPLFLGG